MKFMFAMASGLALVCGAPAFALSVTANNDASQLVAQIEGSTGGATTSGAALSEATTGSAGTFTGGNASGLGIDEGIILSTGVAADAEGPNSSDSTSGAGSTTQLDFTFQTSTGSIFFDYVFASEEYNEFVDSSFNDTFDFILNGPGFANVNIALLPNGDPVEIDTVNLGDNSALFNNNDPSDLGTPTPFDIEYDGFTDVLQAKAEGLTLGVDYTLSLIVSDVGDNAWDSAVFIGAASFGDVIQNPTVPLPASAWLLLAGIGGLAARARRKG